MMEMPTPTPEHARLAAFAGTWVGKEKIHPTPWDPQGGESEGTWVMRMGVCGFQLLCDYAQKREGKVAYEGHGIFGFDPKTQQFTQAWYDPGCPPMGHPAQGAWNGNRLEFTQLGPTGHSKQLYELVSEKEFYFMISGSQDGKQWAPFIEGTFTRR